MVSIVSLASLAVTVAFTLTTASSDGNTTTTVTARLLADTQDGHVCGFDIKGGDVANLKRSDPRSCMPNCQIQVGPITNAVTWTDYEGGTCWCKKIDVNNLKQYLVPKTGAVSFAAGQLPNGDAQYGGWADWDLDGNDLGSIRVQTGPDSNALAVCANFCIRFDKCHAFTITDYESGTCWLKSEAGTQVDYRVNIISGYVVRRVDKGICN